MKNVYGNRQENTTGNSDSHDSKANDKPRQLNVKYTLLKKTSVEALMKEKNIARLKQNRKTFIHLSFALRKA